MSSEIKSINISDISDAMWERVTPAQENITAGVAEMLVHRIHPPQGDNMAVLMFKGGGYTEKTISIAECAAYVISGGGALEPVGKERITFEAGSIFVLPKGVHLNWVMEPDTQIFFVYEPNWTPLKDKNVFEMGVD